MGAGQVRLQDKALASASRARSRAEYQINLTVEIADSQALWTAAAARLLDAPDMTLDDVLDVIGPREDPSIGDCIATLAQPVAVPGCVMDDYWIDNLREARPPLENDDTGAALKRATNTASHRAPRVRRTSPRLALCLPPTLQSDAPVI